jgi:hypothetical protein
MFGWIFVALEQYIKTSFDDPEAWSSIRAAALSISAYLEENNLAITEGGDVIVVNAIENDTSPSQEGTFPQEVIAIVNNVSIPMTPVSMASASSPPGSRTPTTTGNCDISSTLLEKAIPLACQRRHSLTGRRGSVKGKVYTDHEALSLEVKRAISQQTIRKCGSVATAASDQIQGPKASASTAAIPTAALAIGNGAPENGTWLINESYPDREFFDLIWAASIVLERSIEQIVEELGRFFLLYTRCVR